MHTLSLFPQLLSFGLIIPLLFRLTLGTLGILAAKSRYNKTYKWLSLAYFGVSILIVIGLFTQAAALLGIALLAFEWHTENKIAPLSQTQKTLYGLIGILLLSLLFSGAGFLAIDLPL